MRRHMGENRRMVWTVEVTCDHPCRDCDMGKGSSDVRIGEEQDVAG